MSENTTNGTPGTQPRAAEENHSKPKPGASWKAGEQHLIPKNRLGFVFFGLMLTVFLAALDQVSLLHTEAPAVLTFIQTIVATALPTIIAELGGGKNYSWVGR